MQLFDRLPDRFFSILVSSKKELYVKALFVLREAFKSELMIRKEDFLSMLMDSLEEDMSQADFTEEAEEEKEETGYEEAFDDPSYISGKARLLLRRLRETGWIEIENDARSFEESIAIPDYAIAFMNLLYDLTRESVYEYNSYVYATYAALKAVEEDFQFHALQSAYDNTVRLVDEVKSLYNNIRRFMQNLPEQQDVNDLLHEHFDEYRSKLADPIYFPLKTMDSIPRFREGILEILNSWDMDEEIIQAIVSQGIARGVYKGKEEGRERTLSMIHYVVDTYTEIDGLMDQVDDHHQEYIAASTDQMKYLMNTDRGIKGKLIDLLKRVDEPRVEKRMSESLVAFRHQYFDEKSFYEKKKRTLRTEGKPLPVDMAQGKEDSKELFDSFLEGISKEYTREKVEDYVLSLLGEKDRVTTSEIPLETEKDFIFFFLASIQGWESRKGFSTVFRSEENLTNGAYWVPDLEFRRKKKRSKEGKEGA